LPICSVASLFLTGVIELFILFVGSDIRNAELAAGAVFSFMLLCVVVAAVAIIVLAVIAHQRGERWGSILAIVGITTWVATIAKIR
jgi:hypothetical protein